VHHLHLAADQSLDGVDLSLLETHDLVDDSSLELQLAFNESADVKAAPLSSAASVRWFRSAVACSRSSVT
jgi:hypothetical protein